jgi:hypothetical protein
VTTDSTVEHPDRGALDGPSDRRDRIGWLRAILSGVLILVVGLGLSVGVTNTMLTGLTGMSRDTVVLLATGVFLAVVVVMAWVLRRLQARGVI